MRATFASPFRSQLSHSFSTCAFERSYNPEKHQRTKHVERRHFFIRDMVEALELRVPLVPTKENPADFLTKPLDKGLFFAHRDTFMNVRGTGDNTTG